jgi:predicted dehydrogenase
MVRQARAMIAAGAIGRLRMIDGEFNPGTPGIALEPDDPARRHWRFRLDQAGKAGLLGETGSHAYHMINFVTGLYAEEVSSLMATFAERREVYDNAYLTVKFGEGVQGRLWYSYVATGNDHGMTLKFYGDTGSLVWWQEEGEILWHKPMGKPAIRLARGYDGMADDAELVTRIREGHPEGYLMAFANLYQLFAQAIMARGLGRPHADFMRTLPSVEDGMRGIAFIEAATRSQDQGGAWVSVPA